MKFDEQREQKLFNAHNDMEIPYIAGLAKLTGESVDVVKGFLDRNYLNYFNQRERKTVIYTAQGNIICVTCNREQKPNKHKKQLRGYSSECISCKRTKDYQKSRTDVKKVLIRRISHLKSRARRQNLPFGVTREDLLEQYNKQGGLCFYTEEPMNFGKGDKKLDPDTMTIDKIIPENGYVKGNVVICTNKANHAKSFLTLEDMQRWIPEWYKKIITHLTNV